MPTEKKQQQVALLEEKMKTATALVFTNYLGLTANEMMELRREMTDNGVEFRVVKNRLARMAAKGAGVDVAELIEGPTGICFGYDDPAVAFRVANQLSKKFKPYTLQGGVFEGERVSSEDVVWLANLPTREEALARLAAVLLAPVQKLAVALAGPMRNLGVVLREVAKQKD